MALQKSKISIPLAEGIDTKIDPNQRPIGTLENLENAVFDEPGRIKKRTGYVKLDTLLLDESEITDAQRITTYRDELCMFNSTNFYSYSESTNRWTNKGTVSNIFPTTSSVIRNSYQQTNYDCTYTNGITAYIWQDSRGGVRATIKDETTGNELLSDTQISSSGSNPRVETIGDNFYFIYADGTSIKYRTVKPIKPSQIQAEQTIINSDLSASEVLYDTTSASESIFFCWRSAANTLKFIRLDSTGNISSAIEISAETPQSAICIDTDPLNRLMISYYDGINVRFILRSFNLLANLVNPTTIETISNIVNVTATSADSQNYTILYEQSSANSYDHLIRTNTINLSATVGTPSDLIRSCGLATKQFAQNENTYCAVIHSSDLQSTVFVIDSKGSIVSKISQGIAGTLLTAGHLPKVSRLTETRLIFPSQKKGRTVSENNTLFSLLGIVETIIDFNSPVKYDNAFLGEQLHTNGGVIQSYDGNQIVEHGFNLFPENLENAGTATSGGNMSDGVYQYRAIYTWTDNKGQVHRSAPSPALNVTLSGGSVIQTQTVKVPTLRVTEKSNVTIELYRTEDSGTLFYRVSDPSNPTYNDPTVDSLNIVDTTSDSDLIDNELLYTTGGVLDNIAPPSASIIETFQGRVFIAGLEEENQIQFSKVRQANSPVEFNDSQVINVNSLGGKIVALASMDDKLVIFKERAIFYLSGEGPNNLGQQNNYIEPELITNDVGCQTQNSVVLTPLGLMFQTRKGIYLLTRSLGINYIGSPVENFNNLTVRAANLVPKRNIVIFLTNSQALVFDYFVQKWTTYTNHVGISATSLNGEYYYVRQNNQVYKESSLHTDNGSFIKLRLETSWLSLAGIQGYQRVYRMLILGEHKAAHKLIVKVAYNFVDAFIQEKTIDSNDFTRDTIYGEDSPYGTGTPYGGTGNQYQVRVNMKKQKCESLKVMIEDSQSENFGETFELSNILFVVGAKRGEFKLPQSNTYGTN